MVRVAPGPVGDCLRLTEDERTIDELKARVAELERENAELRAKAAGWVEFELRPVSLSHRTTVSANDPPFTGPRCDESPGCVLPRGHGRNAT